MMNRRRRGPLKVRRRDSDSYGPYRFATNDKKARPLRVDDDDSSEMGAEKVTVRTARKKQLASCYSALRDFDDIYPGDDDDDEFDHKEYDLKDYDLDALVGPVPESMDDVVLTTDYVDYTGPEESLKEKGPTTVALICKDGVVVAVDSSAAGTDCTPGASRSAAQNIIEFHSHMFCCITGEMAVCQCFLRDLQQGEFS